MGKPTSTPSEISMKDVSCLENIVVAYNTVFLMSSIFLISIAGTAHELFSDISRILSPSVLLPVIGVFIVLLAGMGYLGIAKESSTLISIYTQLLVFVFALEIAAGLGILSYRGEIRSMLSSKMKKALYDYPNDLSTSNMVDYIQLELNCCGVNSYQDWEDINLDGRQWYDCQMSEIVLPQSCCMKQENDTLQVYSRGCLNTLNLLLHKNSIFLSLGVLAISTIQILGAYFSYSLASILYKYKIQCAKAYVAKRENGEKRPVQSSEKSNYF